MHQASLIRIICDAFMLSYKTKYGEKKLSEVVQKVMSSPKVIGLINTSKFHQKRPAVGHFVQCILSMSFFMFSKKDTEALGCLLAITKWHEEVNINDQLADQDMLKDMAYEILVYCKCTDFLMYLESQLGKEQSISEQQVYPEVTGFLDMERQEKCAIVTSMVQLAVSNKSKPLKEEKEKILIVCKKLDFSITNTDAINEMKAQGPAFIGNILNDLDSTRKAWYILMLHDLFHVEETFSPERSRYFRTMLQNIGVSLEDSRDVASTTMLTADEVLSLFR